MKKKQKRISQKSQKTKEIISISCLLDFDRHPEKADIIFESFQKQPKESNFRINLYIISKAPTREEVTTFKNRFEDLPVTAAIVGYTHEIGEAYREIAAFNPTTYYLNIDFSALKNSFNFYELPTRTLQGTDDQDFYEIHFEEPDIPHRIVKNTPPLLLIPARYFNYIAHTLIAGKIAVSAQISFIIRELGIGISSVKMNQQNPFPDTQKKYMAERKESKFYFQKLILKFYWLVKIPLKEQKSSSWKKYSFIKENPIFRFLFVVIAVALFFIMPLLSLDAGNSGDENKHVDQAEKVYRYFATAGKDSSYMQSSYGPFYAYNITFDVMVHLINKAFDIEQIYTTRHIFNSLTGWLAVLFCGLLCTLIGGWAAGVTGMLLMFFTPCFLGHSFNNPKDIPFAMAYVFTLYYIVKALKEYPRFRIRTGLLIAIGIGISLNVRIGGLLLIVYLAMFTGMRFIGIKPLNTLFTQPRLKEAFRLLLFIIGVSIFGYLLGIAFWPYALENPVENPLNSLKTMTNFNVTLRQVFEGEVYWSDQVPWYYTPKYMLITVPFIVFFGLFLYPFYLFRKDKEKSPLTQFLLIFTFLFPFVYIIIKNSNVYGGWRHLLFAYQVMVVISALGISHVLVHMKRKYLKYVYIAILLILAYKPVRHTILAHPHQYIYFNPFTQGVRGAYGNYEMDYYFHTLRVGAEWLIENEPDCQTQDSLIVASNFSVEYYFRNMDNISTGYFRFYERGNEDWDYALVANTYLSPYQLKKEIWPPVNTIHTINIDGKPMCAILKRFDKNDFYGNKKMKEKKYDEAIEHFEKALEYDPYNEVAMLNMAKCYIDKREYDKANALAKQCLKTYPNYNKAMNFIGIVHIYKNEYNKAAEVFQHIIKLDSKFVGALYNMAVVFYKNKEYNNAIEYLNEAIKVNAKYKSAYLLMAEVLKKQGRMEEAEKYTEFAKSL